MSRLIVKVTGIIERITVGVSCLRQSLVGPRSWSIVVHRDTMQST
jgi:hypothetical protein